MEVQAKEIVLKEISELRPSPKNRNKHSDEQIERLKQIIQYQGFRNPIIVSNRSGYIVAGHGRLMAASKLGMTHVPVIYEDFESEEQEYAAGVSDNSIASWAELDLKGIHLDLPELAPFDINLLGIKDFKFEPDPETNENDPDATPEPPKEAKSKLGELWTLGNHRLLIGDCTVRENVERLMNGEKADMVFTDPPYGMNLQADYSKMHNPVSENSSAKAKVGTAGGRWSNIHGDDKPFNPSHILELFSGVSEIFLWGGDYYCDKLPIGTFIVWDKNNGNESADNMIGNAYELCWSKQKHKRVMARIFGRGTFGHDKVKVHPTQKPTQLAEWFWQRWGKDSKLIWDGYLGSGSTLIACEKTQRKCYGMEIEPLYGDVILTRWAKYTGKDPVREDGVKWSELNA